jgi:DNA-binding NarL/FixJ family response regulator
VNEALIAESPRHVRCDVNHMRHAFTCLIAVPDEELARSSDALLQKWHPELRITRRQTANVEGDHDIVIVGDVYSDGSDGATIAAAVHQTRPNVPVVVVARGLSTERLTRLMNAGCTGVWDGANDTPIDQLRQRVLRSLARRARGGGVAATVRSVADLVIAWNRLLETQEVTR